MLNPESSVLLAKRPLCVYVHLLSMCVFMSVSLHLQFIMFHVLVQMCDGYIRPRMWF